MTISRISFSQKTSHALLGWLTIAALAFHGFIPLGYMPDVSKQTEHPMQMEICNGMDMSSMDMDNGADQDTPAKTKTDNKLPDRPPCPFSVNAIFTHVIATPVLAAPVYIFIAVLSLAAFALAMQRRHLNASPRAPPFPA